MNRIAEPTLLVKVIDTLEAVPILGRKWQTYEAHVPYILQFLLDYNLSGMSYVHLQHVQIRKPIARNCFEGSFELNSRPAENLFWTKKTERETTCAIEVDSWPWYILNAEQTRTRFDDPFRPIERSEKLVPSLEALYIEERLRRIEQGFSTANMYPSKNTAAGGTQRGPFSPWDALESMQEEIRSFVQKYKEETILAVPLPLPSEHQDIPTAFDTRSYLHPDIGAWELQSQIEREEHSQQGDSQRWNDLFDATQYQPTPPAEPINEQHDSADDVPILDDPIEIGPDPLLSEEEEPFVADNQSLHCLTEEQIQEMAFETPGNLQQITLDHLTSPTDHAPAAQSLHNEIPVLLENKSNEALTIPSDLPADLTPPRASNTSNESQQGDSGHQFSKSEEMLEPLVPFRPTIESDPSSISGLIIPESRHDSHQQEHLIVPPTSSPRAELIARSSKHGANLFISSSPMDPNYIAPATQRTTAADSSDEDANILIPDSQASYRGPMSKSPHRSPHQRIKRDRRIGWCDIFKPYRHRDDKQDRKRTRERYSDDIVDRKSRREKKRRKIRRLFSHVTIPYSRIPAIYERKYRQEIEQIEQIEQIQQIVPIEQINQMEQIEPIESIESKEPIEQIDQIEREEQIDQIEQIEQKVEFPDSPQFTPIDQALSAAEPLSQSETEIGSAGNDWDQLLNVYIARRDLDPDELNKDVAPPKPNLPARKLDCVEIPSRSTSRQSSQAAHNSSIEFTTMPSRDSDSKLVMATTRLDPMSTPIAKTSDTNTSAIVDQNIVSEKSKPTAAFVGGRTIGIRLSRRPPSRESAIMGCSIQYQAPFYSDAADIPKSSVRFAGKEFKFKEPVLPDWSDDDTWLSYCKAVRGNVAKERHPRVQTWRLARGPPRYRTIHANETISGPITHPHSAKQNIKKPTQRNKHGFKWSQKEMDQNRTALRAEEQDWLTLMNMEVLGSHATSHPNNI